MSIEVESVDNNPPEDNVGSWPSEKDGYTVHRFPYMDGYQLVEAPNHIKRSALLFELFDTVVAWGCAIRTYKADGTLVDEWLPAKD